MEEAAIKGNLRVSEPFEFSGIHSQLLGLPKLPPLVICP
jgi:hypothetical protein